MIKYIISEIWWNLQKLTVLPGVVGSLDSRQPQGNTFFFVQCSLLEFLEDHLKYEAADVLLMRSSISAVDSFKRITNCPIWWQKIFDGNSQLRCNRERTVQPLRSKNECPREKNIEEYDLPSSEKKAKHAILGRMERKRRNKALRGCGNRITRIKCRTSRWRRWKGSNSPSPSTMVRRSSILANSFHS